jgi:hypothetical protein
MRRAVGILSIAIVPLFVAALACADDRPGERGSSGPGARHETGMGAATSGASGYQGQHAMTGRITDIDKEDGKVTIDAQGEKMTLHFPPSALQTFKEGDQVSVQLAIKRAAGTSGTSDMGAGSHSGTPGSGSGTSGRGTGSGAGTSPQPDGGGTGSRSGATTR